MFHFFLFPDKNHKLSLSPIKTQLQTKITSFHWALLKHSSSHSLTLKRALQALTVQPRQIDVTGTWSEGCLEIHFYSKAFVWHRFTSQGLKLNITLNQLLRCTNDLACWSLLSAYGFLHFFFNKHYCPWPSLSLRLINSALSHCFFGGSSELDTDFSIPVLRPPPSNFNYSSTIVTNVKIFGSSDVLFSFVCFLVYYYIASCLHLS